MLEYYSGTNLNAITNIEECLWDIMFGKQIDFYVTPLETSKDPGGVIRVFNFKKENSNFECVITGTIKYQSGDKSEDYFQKDFEFLIPDINIDPINFHKYAIQIYYKIKEIIHGEIEQ